MVRSVMYTTPFVIVIMLLAVGLFTGCEGDHIQPGTTGNLLLYITDAPGEFDEVNLNVVRVEVHREGGPWEVINNENQTIDLLEYRNGMMAVLADADLDAGIYTQIRLILGDGNNVVVDGVPHNLTVPSGMQTGLKLVRSFAIEPDYTYELVIDFNVHHSIHTSELGYMLKPTVRVEPLALTGAIGGYVTPVGVDAVVSAMQEDEVVTAAYPDETTGMFKMIALPPGEYHLEIEADGFEKYTSDIMVVQAGHTTDAGTIELEASE